MTFCLLIAGSPNAALAADWFLTGSARARAEVLANQFRAGGSGSDQQLATRLLLHARATTDDWTAGVEIQDSRGYFDDDGSRLTTSNINAADILQFYAQRRLEFADDAKATLTLGRQTLDIGSQRQLERVEFANVIFNYTGAYLHVDQASGYQWHALYVVPVGRLPVDPAGLRDNRVVADREQSQRRLWGLHAVRRDAWPGAVPGLLAEAFVYGLRERDTERFPTPNRDYLTVGLRLFRAPAAGEWDFEFEPAWRSGSRRLSAAAGDLRDLDVDAWTVHAHIGYTFDVPWRIRLALDHDQATGDRDPRDDRYDQYERLFGSRRTDLGNTGIYGPLTPANIRATGARIEGAPNARTDFRIAWKYAQLDSATDVWDIASVRDASGRAGRTIGNAYDARLRWWLVTGTWRAEIGFSYLNRGRFARQAPNASREGDPHYYYAQLTWSF